MASTAVEIARPPDEVFAFVTDPTKLSAWQDAEEVQQLTEGPVRAGTRFREVHKTMGRQRVELTEGAAVESRHGKHHAMEQMTALAFRRFHRRLKRALDQGAM